MAFLAGPALSCIPTDALGSIALTVIGVLLFFSFYFIQLSEYNVLLWYLM